MKRLSIPYFSQLDNYYRPTGTCNVTAMAMAMVGCGYRFSKDKQPEDLLFEWLERRGWSRHSPYDLARMVEAYSDRRVLCNFCVDARFEDLQGHIDGGNPGVIHGYFTAFGHIITVVGYDGRGFIVHDPYGEWFPNGYRTDLPGEYLHYSYDLIRRTCMPDGQFWCHLISPEEPVYAPLSDKEKAELSGLRLNDVLDLKLDLEFTVGADVEPSLVKNVQIALELHLKVSPGARDGILGPKTEGAYREAMTAHQCRPNRLGEGEAKLLIQGKL